VAFTAALRLEKESEKAQLGYARALEKLGRTNESLAIYQKVVNSSPGDTGLLVPLGKVLNTAGDHETALSVLLNATTRYPDDILAWNQLAAAYAGQARYEEALTAVRKSLKISLNQSEGWEQLGAVLRGQGKFYESVAAFEKSITLDPKNEDSWAGLGDTWTSLEQYDEAASAYRAATALIPDRKDTWLNLAKIYEKSGKTGEAAAAYARGGAVNLTPGNSTQLIEQVPPENSTPVQETNRTVNATSGP
jgi:tetratricopeptide (TPR) repeat protein